MEGLAAFGVVVDVSFYCSFVQLICLYVALSFFKKKNPFVSPKTEVNWFRDFFLLYVSSSLMKGRFNPDFVFILCFFWKNGNTKNQKFLFFNHFHISA